MILEFESTRNQCAPSTPWHLESDPGPRVPNPALFSAQTLAQAPAGPASCHTGVSPSVQTQLLQWLQRMLGRQVSLHLFIFPKQFIFTLVGSKCEQIQLPPFPSKQQTGNGWNFILVALMLQNLRSRHLTNKVNTEDVARWSNRVSLGRSPPDHSVASAADRAPRWRLWDPAPHRSHLVAVAPTRAAGSRQTDPGPGCGLFVLH